MCIGDVVEMCSYYYVYWRCSGDVVAMCIGDVVEMCSYYVYPLHLQYT